MDRTKAVNLTEVEINHCIVMHGQRLSFPAANLSDEIERINYLNKRLKSFSELEVTEHVKNENNAAGWTNAPASSTGEDM